MPRWYTGRMTTFSITGKRHSRDGDIECTVTWTDGIVTGNPEDVKSVLRLAFEYEGKTIRPFVGPPTQFVHLSSCYSARILMQAIFMTGTARQQGTLPIIPEVQNCSMRARSSSV